MKKIENQPDNLPAYADYPELAKLYNEIGVGEGIDLERKVSNITLFKEALERRSVKSEEDFRAATVNGTTQVLKLTERAMKEA